MFYLLATDLLLLCVIVISFINVAFVCAFVTWIKDYSITYLLTYVMVSARLKENTTETEKNSVLFQPSHTWTKTRKRKCWNSRETFRYFRHAVFTRTSPTAKTYRCFISRIYVRRQMKKHFRRRRNWIRFTVLFQFYFNCAGNITVTCSAASSVALDSPSAGRGFDSHPIWVLEYTAVGQPFRRVSVVSDTTQYNLVSEKGRWCCAARKLTVGLASHLSCATDFRTGDRI